MGMLTVAVNVAKKIRGEERRKRRRGEECFLSRESETSFTSLAGSVLFSKVILRIPTRNVS